MCLAEQTALTSRNVAGGAVANWYTGCALPAVGWLRLAPRPRPRPPPPPPPPPPPVHTHAVCAAARSLCSSSRSLTLPLLLQVHLSTDRAPPLAADADIGARADPAESPEVLRQARLGIPGEQPTGLPRHEHAGPPAGHCGEDQVVGRGGGSGLGALRCIQTYRPITSLDWAGDKSAQAAGDEQRDKGRESDYHPATLLHVLLPEATMMPLFNGPCCGPSIVLLLLWDGVRQPGQSATRLRLQPSLPRQQQPDVRWGRSELGVGGTTDRCKRLSVL